MKNLIRNSLIAITFLLPLFSQGQSKSEIDWEKFLSGSDLITDNLGKTWDEGYFTGNGLLGTMVYQNVPANAIRIDVGRTDVRDHQGDGQSPLLAKARMPIGYFLLKPSGTIKRVNARLNLWNAEVTGTIVTDKGSISFSNLTFSKSPVIYLKTEVSGNEENPLLEWVPLEAKSSRVGYAHVQVPDNYKGNNKGALKKEGEINYYQQPLLAGGGYSTAWKKNQKRKHQDFLITISYATKGEGYVNEAIKALNKFGNKSISSLIKEHRGWWHTYYPQSFLTFADSRIQSFYWIQQYKLASATGAGKPALDLMGPWFKTTPWPAYWFNLNFQLTYSPLYAANRLNIAQSLVAAIDRNQQNLINNVPKIYRDDAAAIGRAGGEDFVSPVQLTANDQSAIANGNAELSNLTWVLYYYWQHYRYSMDKNIGKNLFPILKRSVNYAMHLLSADANGQLSFHVKTYSPEYPTGTGTNTNYDLSLLRWGCKTLIELDKELDKKDPLASKWQNVLDKLISYPADESGYRIASDIPFDQSHRHYSHLLMIYPLYDVNWDQEDKREIISKSLAHWHSFPTALQGYSFTGGASIYTMMGKGTEAVGYLNNLLDRFVLPNTMYLESGPVIETPLAAAESIQELYLQYWNNVVRIFPAVPKEWKNAGFENMRTDGAFLISAVHKDGKTKWIKIKSLNGGQITIKPGLEGVVKMKSSSNSQLTAGDEGNYTCVIPKGKTVTLYAAEEDLNIKMADVITFGKNNLTRFDPKPTSH